MSRSWTLQEAALGLDWNILQYKKPTASSDSSNSYGHVDTFRRRSGYKFLTSEDTITPQHSANYYTEEDAIDVSMPYELCNPDRTEVSQDTDLHTMFRDMHNSATTQHMRAWRTGWTLSPALGQVIRFTRIWNSLAGRTTMKKEDQHIIITTLLGLSVTQVLKIEGRGKDLNLRMKALLKQQRYLPTALLYEFGPRPSLITDRWLLPFPGLDILQLEYGIMK